MSSKSLSLSVLVLLSVLNTYSLPVVTLYKAIQLAEKPHCPVFRSIAEDTPEPEYLQGCLYPLNPKSNDINVIRCNLYFNQFNLMCELSLPKFEASVFLSSEEMRRTLAKSNPCQMFSTPVNANNSSNIDGFIAEKCKTICTDIRTDEFETICLAASYLRMVANMLSTSANKTYITQIDASGRALAGIRVTPQSEVQAPVKIEENLDNSHNTATSGNDASPAGPTGNAAGPETAPLLMEPPQNNVVPDNTAKFPVEHDSSLGKGIGNVVISGGGKITEDVVDHKAVAATPVLTVPKSEEIPKSNESVKLPPKIPISPEPESIPEKVVVTAPQGDSKSTTSVKHDIVNSVDTNQVDTNQETAFEADYTDKGALDIDSIENNPPPELESNIPKVIIKHPGMTEDEDEKLVTRNMYRDDRTVEDDSYFFTYFMMLCVVFIFAYVGYHNKQKIIAIVVEGRRGSSGGGRGGRSRGGRRPNSANYHKLDSNLEEAVSSNTPNKNTSKVIY